MTSAYLLMGEVSKKAFVVTGKKSLKFALYPSFHHPLPCKGKGLCNSSGHCLEHLTDEKLTHSAKSRKNIMGRWDYRNTLQGRPLVPQELRGRSDKLRGLRSCPRRILTPLPLCIWSLEHRLEAQQEQAPPLYRDRHRRQEGSREGGAGLWQKKKGLSNGRY